MLLRRDQAFKGFQTFIKVKGIKDEKSVYCVILGNLAARLEKDDAAAKAFLNESEVNVDEAWPNPAVRFLKGEIDETALSKPATDDDKRTEARCYLGLDHLIKGNKKQAVEHFRWVKEHGTPSFVEYAISLAELDRLEKEKR